MSKLINLLEKALAYFERKRGLTYDSALEPMAQIQRQLEAAHAYQEKKKKHHAAIIAAETKKLSAAAREAGRCEQKAKDFSKLLESDTV